MMKQLLQMAYKNAHIISVKAKTPYMIDALERLTPAQWDKFVGVSREEHLSKLQALPAKVQQALAGEFSRNVTRGNLEIMELLVQVNMPRSRREKLGM